MTIDLPREAVEAGADALERRLRSELPMVGEAGIDLAAIEADVEVVLTAAVPHLRTSTPDVQLTPVEKVAIHADLHMTTCSLPLLDCAQCRQKLGEIRSVVNAIAPIVERQARQDERTELAAAGRLLAAGCAREEVWRIRWSDGEPGFVGEWGCNSLARARELVREESPDYATGAEISYCEQWTSPWSVVESIAVQGADRGEVG